MMRIKTVSFVLILAILFSSNSISLASEEDASAPIIASVGYVEAAPRSPVDANPTNADPSDAIDKLTKQIILKIIELEKFNLHYRMEVGKQGRWAGWRYATLQEANFCLNLASGIGSVSERTSHFKEPDKLSRGTLERCNLTSMIGYIIGASAGALELGITEFHDLQASKNGFSPKLAKAHVLSLKNEINKLLLERQALLKIEPVAPLLLAHAQIDIAEGKVLTDLRDLALLEFEKFHISARRYVAFQKSLYFLDMTKYTCAGIGSFFAYMSEHRHDRRWNLRAGIMYDIAGSLIIATPFVSRGIGIVAQKIQRHYISPIIDDVRTTQIATLMQDEAALEKVYQETKSDTAYAASPLKRIAAYHTENHHFESEFQRILRTEHQGKLTATQNMMAGSFSGVCHLAGGILYTSAGKIANGKTLRDASVTNYNLATAAIISIPGNTVAILDTLRIQVQAEIDRHKRAKTGRLSSQLFAANLSQLEQMEQQLNADK